MALTTKDGTKLGQNIVPDVNANIAVATPSRQISPEVAILFNKSIVARPLMAPEVCSIRIKNTEYRYRWVNKLAQHGQFFNMRKTQGFVCATTDDVDVLGGDAVANTGEISAGDLVLMKIRADLYDGAIKWNMEKAGIMARTRGVMMENASSDVNSDAVAKRVSVSQEPFSKNGLAQPFIPDNPDQIVNDSVKTGRAELTRKTVQELRDGAKG